MNKIKIAKDKLAIILGAGLLGYYLAISIFRNVIMRGLYMALPPINNRHLPQYYVGFEGGAIALIIAYLAYTAMVEKKSVKQYKGHYIAALGSLIVLPLLIAGAFRLDAVSYVRRAESTTPTDIRIATHENHILFLTGTDGSSGTGYSKTVVIDETNLKAAGEMIRKMRFLGVKDETGGHEDAAGDVTEYPVFIDYTIDGKWYSKILTYKEGVFEESVGLYGTRTARYESQELEALIEKEKTAAGNINYYNRATIADPKTIENPEERISLEGADFDKLRGVINDKNEITPQSTGTERIDEALKNGIKQDEKDIYAIELLRTGSETGDTNRATGSDNFMVYDDAFKVLYFEGKYYHVPEEAGLNFFD